MRQYECSSGIADDVSSTEVIDMVRLDQLAFSARRKIADIARIVLVKDVIIFSFPSSQLKLA
jgi:hypothetical protein